MKKIQKGARVLVTGGTGFAGAHVVEALVKRGANVISTYQTEDPRSYFDRAGLGKKVKKMHLDIRDRDGLRHVISRFDIEHVLHLAAQPIVDTAFDNPYLTLETNIMGTAALLEACRMNKTVKSILVASSDKAYGKHGKVKYVESDPLVGDHPYEVSKSAADLLCNMYVKTYGLPVVVTRFGNIYGEGDLNMSRILPGIMNALFKKRTLEIRSDGTYIRDYLYVKDVARGYLGLLDNIDDVRGETFNFGSKETVSVIQLINIVKKTLKKKLPFTVVNSAKNEIPYQSLDFTKITKSTGWTPKGTFKTTLPGIYRWYAKALQEV